MEKRLVSSRIRDGWETVVTSVTIKRWHKGDLRGDEIPQTLIVVVVTGINI